MGFFIIKQKQNIMSEKYKVIDVDLCVEFDNYFATLSRILEFSLTSKDSDDVIKDIKKEK